MIGLRALHPRIHLFEKDGVTGPSGLPYHQILEFRRRSLQPHRRLWLLLLLHGLHHFSEASDLLNQ